MIDKIIVEDFRGELLVTITRSERRYWLFGEIIKFRDRYMGSGTVWYKYPDGIRCETDMEYFLTECAKRYTWSKISGKNR